MNPSDSRLPIALQASLSKIRATAATSIDRVELTLGINATSALTNRERQAFASAQIELRRKLEDFNRVFGDALTQAVTEDVSPRLDPSRRLATTDWMSLSLVEDREVEDKVFADRLGQAIAHDCEWELRDLASYVSALMRTARGDSDRNPLRPEIIGKALQKGIDAVTQERDLQRILARELGGAMALGMKSCYADILADLRARGIQPLGLSVKTVEGPGNDVPRNTSGYTGHSEFNLHSGPGDTLGLPSTSQAAGLTIPSPLTGHPHSAGSMARRSVTAGLGHRANNNAATEAQLMTLIRRLAILASSPADLGGPAGSGPSKPGARPEGFDHFMSTAASLGGGLADSFAGRAPAGSDFGQPSSVSGAQPGAASGSASGAGQSGLMAVNLIRAHRDELIQASTGTLDHMVIDVVGSLFDQILSDPKVPPQMARQIARLQLPVLRVALGDVGFFSSRRHPVRRFVNRMASLACAFDEFDDGPGKRFLALVRELVQDIVQGDFDQMDLYESKLAALEAFIAAQTEEEVEQRGPTTALLESKEVELRMQQRYMLQLKNALAHMPLPDFIRDFLCQVWSQTILRAAVQDGSDSALVARFRQTGRNLVMSVQPKGTPAHRKNFLMQLPALMKDLNEGLDRIGWPETAKRDFFARLLPAHAESLKGRTLSELEHNLLVKELDGVMNMPLPRADDVTRADALPVLTDVVAATPRFTPQEAEQVGLVEETEVDWDGTVDIDLTLDEVAAEASVPPDGSLDIDQDLAMTPKEPPEPTHGSELMEHIKLGYAYQMHLKDAWQKVRLSHVSPGRAFFVFTHGKRHQETISMTARMLARMCATERLRSYEGAALIERATSRARKQLAALGTTAAVQHAAGVSRH